MTRQKKTIWTFRAMILFLTSVYWLVVIASEASINPKSVSSEKPRIVYGYCWPSERSCDDFQPKFRNPFLWNGDGGCQDWCACQGYPLWKCVEREADHKPCWYRNWRCQCYGHKVRKTCYYNGDR